MTLMIALHALSRFFFSSQPPSWENARGHSKRVLMTYYVYHDLYSTTCSGLLLTRHVEASIVLLKQTI